MATKSVKKTDRLAGVLLLMIAFGNFSPHPHQDISVEPYGGHLVSKINNIASYLLLSYLVVKNWKGVVYSGTRNIPLLLLLGLIHISILWSADPQQTLEYSKGMIRVSFLAAYLSWQYSIVDQMWMLCGPLIIEALLSLFVGLFFPSYGASLDGWNGVYGHKNTLGSNMALSAGIFLHLALSNSQYWWILWPGFALSVILVVLSKSTTSLGIVLAFIILLLIYKLIQKNQYKLQVIFIAFAILGLFSGAIWLLNNATSLVATQGKDLSLTGRTPLWTDLLDKIAHRPFLGYGFFGFWNSVDGLDVHSKYQWAGQAHNGFIQLALELGLVGFILFTISLIQFFFKALSRILFHAKAWEDFWPMQFLVLLVINNCSEADLLGPGTPWLLYVTILLSLSLEPLRTRKIQISGIR